MDQGNIFSWESIPPPPLFWDNFFPQYGSKWKIYFPDMDSVQALVTAENKLQWHIHRSYLTMSHLMHQFRLNWLQELRQVWSSWKASTIKHGQTNSYAQVTIQHYPIYGVHIDVIIFFFCKNQSYFHWPPNKCKTVAYLVQVLQHARHCCRCKATGFPC